MRVTPVAALLLAVANGCAFTVGDLGSVTPTGPISTTIGSTARVTGRD